MATTRNRGGRFRKMPAAVSSDYTVDEDSLIKQTLAGAPRLGDTLTDPGDEEGVKWALPVDIDTLETNGYVVVYNRHTREPSVIHRNSLRAVLRDRIDPETGQLAFTLDQPDEPPYRGTLKCFLHADDPNRLKYDMFGFARCRKSNLPTEYQRGLHMTKKHKAEWAAIQAAKSDDRLEEEREYRKAILARLRADEPVPLAALLGGM